MDLDRIVNIEDFRRAAKRRLPRAIFDFIDGGAGSEDGLRRNRAALEAIRFVPRVLVDVAKRSTATTMLGGPVRAPIAVAPVGIPGFYRHRAEIMLARAAARLGLPFALCTAATVSMEEVAASVAEFPSARLWFQLYFLRDRAKTQRLIERAKDAGYEALILTVDVIVPGKRERDLRNGFGLSAQLSARAALGFALRPRWFFDVFLRGGLPKASSPFGPGEPGSLLKFMKAQHYEALTWDDLAWIRSIWPRKLVVKGILSEADAGRAAQSGVDAIVVSNHGGRQLDGAVAPIEVLGGIVDRLGGRIEVIADSGFYRGEDIVKALALGASGVLVGRAPIYGSIAGGEPGAQRALGILIDETDRTMALIGCPTVKDIARDRLLLPRA